jgi:L-2,4-diaminobutyrate decarboxylase
MHKDILQQAYDPESFRKLGHELVDQLADQLAAAQQGRGKAIPYTPPASEQAYWEADWQQGPQDNPIAFFQQILDRSVQLHHPRYMGHQVCPPAPLATLSNLVDGMLNNGAAVYEMGMAATALEQLVIKEVATAMGFESSAGGVLTSGGTLANLTALLAARAIKCPDPVWTEGHKAPLALMVSEEAHYCVDRAVRIMGWGEAGIIKVPADEQYRMRHELLPEYLAKARAEGKQVIAVVGSACSTSTGSFDNLSAIADFCEAEGLWLHVDGAHGAALAFSKQYRSVVQGLERADSVAMDFHKMLMTPVLATALIFRNGQHAYRTFSQRAQYLWEGQTEEEWHNLAKRTFECTKYMIGMKVYSLLRTYGTELWTAYVDRVVGNGQLFSRLLQAEAPFELAVEPSCNIVCFRYRAEGMDEAGLNALNARIRQQLLEEGQFYIVQTMLRGELFLRVTLTNPFTSEADLQALLQRCATVAEEHLKIVS